MARSLTNNLAMAVAIETSIGVLPATPLWVKLEPNSIGAYGATITTVPRNPISNTRQQRKGSVTDLDSSVEWEGDMTKDHVLGFAEGFIFGQRQNSTVMERVQAGSDYEDLAAVNATNAYSHTALSAALVVDTLVFVRGMTTAANNGLKEVAAASTTILTIVEGAAPTDETPANSTGARMDVCGHRLADATWDDTAKAVGSSAKDLTTFGLSVGQSLRVGSDANALTGGQLVGRIISITAALITLDKVQNLGVSTLNGGGNVTADACDLLYGQFVKNVAVSSSDFLQRSFGFELAYDDLQNPAGTGDEYEYALGNLCNELTINMPGQDKATLSFGFIGTTTEDITETRKTNSAEAVEPLQTAAFNTAASFARLNMTDTSEVSLGACFKSLTIVLGNEVSPEKCLGTLGAFAMNTGNFKVSLDAELLFTDSDLAQAVKDNQTITMDFLLENDDGAVALDIPSMTLGGGTKNYPVNESIKISVTGEAFGDTTLDTSIGFTEYPYFPTVA
tara:strand:- start:36079 stop:37599 length:1521 start_codon:yes stop_codon:yes gene_type:complete